MAVIAPNVVDAVRYTGGWLFDRALAGWEVTVLVPDLVDGRPLRILGATVLDLEESLASPPERGGAWPHDIAVARTVFESDPRVREGVLENLTGRSCEVMVWGDGCPSELDCRTAYVEHRLTTAARAFKARALAAAAQPIDAIDEVEMFRRGGPLDRLATDLVRVG
jgi:hypothetical protein